MSQRSDRRIVEIKGPSVAQVPQAQEALLDLGAWAPEAAALHRAAVEATLSCDDEVAGALEGLAGCPSLDLIASPMSARASFLGLGLGRRFYHHELKLRLPMPQGLEPELEVWSNGETVPQWRGGVLEEPKYFSFFQDSPFAAYNPNYRRKWRPHELLHGALGFFWHPQQTRFEMYLGARYNELLPVVLWYGLDEIKRQRCAAHEDAPSYRAHCAQCEQIEAGWLSGGLKGDADFELGLAASSRAHLLEEWEALSFERVSGRRRACPRPGLDSSSDAIGYLRGHWPRVTAWSFGQWVEMFLLEGEDYSANMDAYAAKVAGVFGAWVSGDLALDLDRAALLVARRQHQELAYRALLSLESMDEGLPRTQAIEQACFEVLEEQAARVEALWVLAQSGGPIAHDAAQDEALFERLAACFDPVDGPRLLALGMSAQAPNAIELAQLTQGLIEGLPMTLERSGLELEEELVRAFVGWEGFGAPEPLVARFARFLEEAWPIEDDAPIGWASLEAWLQCLVSEDEEAECFAVLPDDFAQLEADQVRLNVTASRRIVPVWLAQEILGVEALAAAEIDEAQEDVELLAARFRGEVRLLIVDEVMSQALFMLEDGQLPGIPSLVTSLLEEGVLVWSPSPAGRTDQS